MFENQMRSNGWRGRLWGWAGGNLARYGGLLEASATPNLEQAEGDVPRPTAEYAVRWAYRENRRLYKRLHAWGLVEWPWRTVYNPVPAVIAFYLAHTLAGDVQIVPVERAAADDASKVRDAALVAAIGRVQERSNWRVFLRELVEDAAVFSDVIIKAATRTDDVGAVSSVYLQLLPVTSIRRCEVDERGYVRALRIDTPRFDSVFGGQSREHTHVEIWDNQGVRFYETEGRVTVDDDKLPEAVGAQTFEELQYDFIPVVWARCATYWWDVVDQIDERNQLAWLLDLRNRPLLLVSANATDERGFPLPAPAVTTKEPRPGYEEIGHGAAAVMRLPGQATAAWSGAPVDFGVMQQEMATLQEHIEGSLPEYLVAARLQAVQVAAETLDKIQAQAGHRVLEMRGTLEAGLVRAQMMALTLGQVAGLAGFSEQEIGTYDAGDFGHTFAARPVFQKTAGEMAAEVRDLTAGGATLEGAARVAGYNEQQVEELVNLSIATFPEEERDDAR